MKERKKEKLFFVVVPPKSQKDQLEKRRRNFDGRFFFKELLFPVNLSSVKRSIL